MPLLVYRDRKRLSAAVVGGLYQGHFEPVWVLSESMGAAHARCSSANDEYSFGSSCGSHGGRKCVRGRMEETSTALYRGHRGFLMSACDDDSSPAFKVPSIDQTIIECITAKCKEVVCSAVSDFHVKANSLEFHSNTAAVQTSFADRVHKKKARGWRLEDALQPESIAFYSTVRSRVIW